MKIHIDRVDGLRIEHLSITQMAPEFSGDAMESMERLMQMLGRTESVIPGAAAHAGRPAIGEYWSGQGGIYAGDFRAGVGTVYGLIVAKEEDVGRARWAQDGERDLSEWDGLANTATLRTDCPAAKLAAEYERDEHSDFYLPARRELQLAVANVPDKFGDDGYYWTSTSRGEYFAWAVDFEHGYTTSYFRHYEFRVRPFRRFIY